MDTTTLHGKVAIVTGSAQGIGKSIAEKLIERGATVVGSDVQRDAGAATAAALGARAIFIPCNVTSYEEVSSLVEATVARFGRLDVMVNNAGINSGRSEDRVTAERYPLETWRRIIEVDLNGTFYCCRVAGEQMVRQKSGSIINVASVAGVVALRLQVGYVAAKAAVIRMSEAMACELAPSGIRVNVVSPGSILTEGTRELFYADSEKARRILSFIPQGRPGETRDIADAVAFLASDAASYVNGHNLIVDGGWTCGFNRDF
jgi:NAD(P)-dependent dehydrogenase (short-subunit alcohol dehydrogenase family)